MIYSIEDVGDTPGRKPRTDAEKQGIVDEWNANEMARPLRDWVGQMVESDQIIMPRWAEDMADALIDLGGTLPAQTMARIQAKKDLRNAQPAQPKPE